MTPPCGSNNTEAEMLRKDEAKEFSEPENKHIQILSVLIAMGPLWFAVTSYLYLSPCQMAELLLY